MDTISRQSAKELGLVRYFTGKPCSRGHVAPRLVSNWACYQCSLESSKKWHQDNPQVYQRYKYGITQQDLEEMNRAQSGACATCLIPFVSTYHVDHDHKTGRVRGLLCKACNWALGHAKDDPRVLRRMADYLDRQVGSP